MGVKGQSHSLQITQNIPIEEQKLYKELADVIIPSHIPFLSY